MQPEAGVPAGALHGVGGRELSHAHDLPDEAPLVDVGEIAEMAQEPDELGPAVGVDVDQARAAKAEDDLARASLERGRGVVEGRRARPQHRHALAGQRREVDLLAGVRVEPRRQAVADHRRDLPLPRPVDPGRQDDPPREQRLGRTTAARVRDGHLPRCRARVPAQRPHARIGRTGMSSVRRYQARYAAQVSLGMSPIASQLPAPCCASYQARGVRLGTPRSGPVTYFGVRSVRIRAKLSQGPARSSGFSSTTSTFETRSRARPNAAARPPCPAPTIRTSRTSTTSRPPPASASRAGAGSRAAPAPGARARRVGRARRQESRGYPVRYLELGNFPCTPLT